MKVEDHYRWRRSVTPSGRQHFGIEEKIEEIEDTLIDVLTLVRQDKLAFAKVHTSTMQTQVKSLRKKLTSKIEEDK